MAATCTTYGHRRKQRRPGTTAVEAAIVLPVFLLMVLALVEFSYAMLVKNVLRGACRTAARMASTGGQTTAEVEDHVRQLLGSAIHPSAVQVFVKDASSLDGESSIPSSGESLENLPSVEVKDAQSRQLFMVRARVNYYDVALIPMPFSEGIVLEGQAFTRRE